MTRNQERSLGLALILLILVIVAVTLGGCGPAYHLQRSKHHLQRAIDKGAEVDTKMKTFHFKSPEIKFSTTIRPTWINGAPVPLWRDTLIYTDKKTGSIIKAKITQDTNCPDSCNRIQTVYLKADVPAQDLKEEVPCETIIKAGYTVWEMVILAIACLAAGAVLGRLFWR